MENKKVHCIQKQTKKKPNPWYLVYFGFFFFVSLKKSPHNNQYSNSR